MKRKKIEKKLALNKTTVSDLNPKDLESIHGGGTIEECTIRVCTFFNCTLGPRCTRQYDCTDVPMCY